MKKTRMLTLALIVMVMLMGAGYAYWSDTLTINNTVATGEFKVEFAEPTWYLLDNSHAGGQLGNDEYTTTDGYAEATFSPFILDGKQGLDLTLVNLYPGKAAVLDTHFVNQGTIPAVIKDVKITDETVALTGKNGAALVKMTDEQKANIKVTGTIQLAGDNSESLTLDTNLAGLQNALDEMEGWRLEPEETIDFSDVTFALPTTITNDDNMENLYAKCKIEFVFGQHNQ